MKYDALIAIDPDVTKSGVAFCEVASKKVEATNLTFPLLMDYLVSTKVKAEATGKKVAVIVEAGYLNAPHFHLTPNDSKQVAAAKGNAVGRNHETARKIIEMCQHYGMDVHGVKPLKKIWHTKDHKISHEELQKVMMKKGYQPMLTRTNQDMRDALLLLMVFV